MFAAEFIVYCTVASEWVVETEIGRIISPRELASSSSSAYRVNDVDRTEVISVK